MAKHINIKAGKPQLFGRAPWPVNDKHSDTGKNLRYYKYQVLFNYYHPHLNHKPVVAKPIQQKIAIVESDQQFVKNNWLESMSHWFVELFTREKSNHEIFSGTA